MVRICTGLTQQGGLQHAANAAIAIPEGVDEFEVQVDQRHANERRHLCLHQLPVSLDHAPDVFDTGKFDVECSHVHAHHKTERAEVIRLQLQMSG